MNIDRSKKKYYDFEVFNIINVIILKYMMKIYKPQINYLTNVKYLIYLKNFNFNLEVLGT